MKILPDSLSYSFKMFQGIISDIPLQQRSVIFATFADDANVSRSIRCILMRTLRHTLDLYRQTKSLQVPKRPSISQSTLSHYAHGACMGGLWKNIACVRTLY